MRLEGYAERLNKTTMVERAFNLRKRRVRIKYEPSVQRTGHEQFDMLHSMVLQRVPIDQSRTCLIQNARCILLITSGGEARKGAAQHLLLLVCIGKQYRKSWHHDRDLSDANLEADAYPGPIKTASTVNRPM